MIDTTDAATLTDAELDAAFAAAYDLHDQNATVYYSTEIVNRLASLYSFAAGLLGQDRFPLYEARVNFSQSQAAQSSVKDSAGNIASAAKTGLFALGGGAVVGLAVVGVAAWWWYFGRRK